MKNLKSTLRLSLILIAAAIGLLPMGNVYAITAPESVSISRVDVYRNLAETGDVAIFFHYDMPYASDNYTDTPASETILFRLYDTDGTTLLQAGSPYVNPFFGSNGYGEGTGAFYFSANESYTWEATTSINIYGLPAFFSENVTQTYTLTSTDYVTETTQDANRALLKSYILLECDKLAAAYADTGIILKTTSDSGIVLSPYGEVYFKGVVNGLQNLCPELFFIQAVIPETMDVNPYDMSQGTIYTGRLAGDDLGEGFDNIGSLIGVGGGTAAAIIVFLLTMWLSIWTSKKGWGAEIGLIGGALVATGFALLVGDIVFTVLMIGSIVAAMGIVYIVILKRA